jgi:hypothetical protein
MKSGKHAMATLEPTATTKLARLIDYLPGAFPYYAGHCKGEDHVGNLHSSADNFNTE